ARSTLPNRLIWRSLGPARPRTSRVGHLTVPYRGTATTSPPPLMPPLAVRCSRSRRVPREPLDTRHDRPEQGPCQGAFGELQGEAPGMADEPRAGLEQPSLRTRQRPALDSPREGESALLSTPAYS